MNDEYLKIAKKAALEAGKIVGKYAQGGLTLHSKGHYTNFATEADIKAEEKILEIIQTNFPNHNIIAEESGSVKTDSEYTWIIDPIDGTIPFVDGLPTFGISIGVFKNNQPFVGVINMVATNQLYWAQKGKGAFLNGKKIQVRKEADLQQSTIGMEWGHTNRINKMDTLLRPIAEKVRYIYSFGSVVFLVIGIAQGKIDGCIIRANLWDLAAGVILVTEAGGKVTDILGKPVNYSESKLQVICSNGFVHDDIVKVYK